MYDAASNADLDNEFGTHVDAEVIEKILREGTLTEGHVSFQTRKPRPARRFVF